MLLKPAVKDYLWGGTRLKSEYNKKTGLVPLAETWECSVHPDGPSTVVNGEYAGQTLDKVLKAHPEFMGTNVNPDNGLPIMVKLIDAEKDLSIQVHPDDIYAREHEHQNGKTEMWYVLDAKPGASLIYGFAHSVTKEMLRKAFQNGQLSEHLRKVQVHKGDVFYIPAGTVHAIGAGLLIAEIQENSNVTYRVYDYDRVDKNGKKRELHFDKAIEVMNMDASGDSCQKPATARCFAGYSEELLCRCPYFETEKIQVTKDFSFSVTDTTFQVVLCLEGDGSIEATEQGRAVRFAKGSCIFIPAGTGQCRIQGNTAILKIRC